MIQDSQKYRITQLIPSLLEKKDIQGYVNILPGEELKEYVRACLAKADYLITEEDMLVCEVMCDLAILRGQIQPRLSRETNEIEYVPTDVLATMLVAALIRNTYFDEEHPVTSLFKAREELYELGKDPNTFTSGRVLNDQTLQQIFQCVEAQLGPLTPVETAAPVMRSPQEDFSTAIFIAKNIKLWSR